MVCGKGQQLSMNDILLCSCWYSVLCQRHNFITLRWFWFNKALLYSTWNPAQYYVAAWIGGELDEEWIHVYVWLSPYTVNLKLLQKYLCFGYTPIQNKTVIFFPLKMMLIVVCSYIYCSLFTFLFFLLFSANLTTSNFVISLYYILCY